MPELPADQPSRPDAEQIGRGRIGQQDVAACRRDQEHGLRGALEDAGEVVTLRARCVGCLLPADECLQLRTNSLSRQLGVQEAVDECIAGLRRRRIGRRNQRDHERAGKRSVGASFEQCGYGVGVEQAILDQQQVRRLRTGRAQAGSDRVGVDDITGRVLQQSHEVRRDRAALDENDATVHMANPAISNPPYRLEQHRSASMIGF